VIGEDLSPFFVAGEFAGSADTLNGVTVVGIFDGAYVATGDGIGMSSTRPVYTLPTSAVPVDQEGLVLVAGGKHFTVAAQEPDGTGVTMLILENA
jgi:hypothetical protein